MLPNASRHSGSCFGKTTTSTVPSRSSRVQVAILSPRRVTFSFSPVTRPPIRTSASCFSAGSPPVVVFAYSVISPAKESIGCPVM